MSERAIDRLVAKARDARDKRRPKVWHFIRANWPKFRRLVDQDAVTYRALAEMLADEPEVQEGGKGPSEFAVRRAYLSVQAHMSKVGEKPKGAKPPRPKAGALRPLQPGEVAVGVKPVTPERCGGDATLPAETEPAKRSRFRSTVKWKGEE